MQAIEKIMIGDHEQAQCQKVSQNRRSQQSVIKFGKACVATLTSNPDLTLMQIELEKILLEEIVGL